MAQKTLRVAILGAGTIANMHAEVFKSVPEYELVAVWRRNTEKGREFAQKHGTLYVESADEIIAREDVDVVDIAAPPKLHHELGEKAAAAGKHVIVEKPIDASLEGADRLINACEKAGVTLAVISQYRFTDGARFIKQAIEDGAFGKLIQGDAFVKWYRPQEYYDKDAWRGDPVLEGGGALINQAIHFIDLLLWWLGPVQHLTGKVKTVSHDIPVEDHGVALLEFENGALGLVEGSTAIVPGFPARAEVHGQKGSARFEGDTLTLWEVEGYDREPPLAQARQSGAREAMAIDIEPIKRQFLDIHEAITTGRKPLVDGAEARRALELVLAIYKSSREERRLRLPL